MTQFINFNNTFFQISNIKMTHMIYTNDTKYHKMTHNL